MKKRKKFYNIWSENGEVKLSVLNAEYSPVYGCYLITKASEDSYHEVGDEVDASLMFEDFNEAKRRFIKKKRSGINQHMNYIRIFLELIAKTERITCPRQ